MIGACHNPHTTPINKLLLRKPDVCVSRNNNPRQPNSSPKVKGRLTVKPAMEPCTRLSRKMAIGGMGECWGKSPKAPRVKIVTWCKTAASLKSILPKRPTPKTFPKMAMTTNVPRTINHAKPAVVTKSQRSDKFLSVNPYGFNEPRYTSFCRIKVAYAGAGI